MTISSRLFFTWTLCGVLGGIMLGVVACSDNSHGPCQSDYNCPADKPYCVARACVASIPNTESPTQEAVQEPGSSESTSDASPQEQATSESTGAEPSPESSVASCSTQEDCKEAAPWCRFGQCSEGYIYFDFLKAMPILDPAQDLQTACTAHTQCKNWQSCVSSGSMTFCYTTGGRTSEAKGKIKDDGLFLQGRSYGTIVLENAKEIVRMVMVGEFSDKLEIHLEIDVPADLMNSNTTLDVEKSKLNIRMYNVKIEFVPPIRELLAVGVRGIVTLNQAVKTYSTRDTKSLLIGSADLVLKRP